MRPSQNRDQKEHLPIGILKIHWELPEKMELENFRRKNPRHCSNFFVFCLNALKIAGSVDFSIVAHLLIIIGFEND